MSSSPIVALVGRPNVGKSALFNRMVGQRQAIVDSTPGVTRDRLYAPVEWAGRTFTLVDTGGIQTGRVEDLAAQTRAQAEIAIEEAAVVLFVVDAQTGVLPEDIDVAGLLRPRRDKVLLVANKVESPQTDAAIYEFCSLGFDVPYAVSAIHGLNSGDLLDTIVAKLPPEDELQPRDENVIHLAIVGRPNVGKSSLVNALLGKQRVVVSPEPGTTRDSTDTATQAIERDFIIIDTAGLRRHDRYGGAPLDYFSSLRAVAAIGRCDIALLLIDALAGVTEQDRRIAGLAIEEGKSLALLVNKWDLVDTKAIKREDVETALRTEFAFAPYAPILFGSALTKKGVNKIWSAAAALFDERRKRITTAKLNEVVRDVFRVHPPALFRGRELKFYYATQTGIAPPEFVFFVNDPRLLHFSYQRHIENALREAFGFAGTPLRTVFRPRVRQDSTKAEDVILDAAGKKR